MSGMLDHTRGLEGRATEGSREGGLSRAHTLLWLRVCDSGGARHLPGNLEKKIAEEVGAVAGGGRQGTADDREKRFSVRGHRGRIIARGS